MKRNKETKRTRLTLCSRNLNNGLLLPRIDHVFFSLNKHAATTIHVKVLAA